MGALASSRRMVLAISILFNPDAYIHGLRTMITIAADFVLIAGLAYILLNALRNTPALPFLLSLAILALVYVGVDALGLYGVDRIFSYAPQWLVIAVIVLFQEDIRRLILKANPNNLLKRFIGQSAAAQKAESELTEVIVRATSTLSSKGLGALIVYDKAQDLGDYAAGGIQVDSVLSEEILHAIFIDRFANPLHDGATIISTDRIIAAACFLPLTTRMDIDPSLGTRHRAALGLSEETGSIVVVVSEETRQITICYQGRYWRYKGTESDDVRGKLQELLRPRRPRERGTEKGG